jgi:hypothetical protein
MLVRAKNHYWFKKEHTFIQREKEGFYSHILYSFFRWLYRFTPPIKNA